MSRTAIIAGATGLVGSALLDQLLTDAAYARVIVLARRAPIQQHPKLAVILSTLEDFDSIDAVSLAADVAFCALGTTTAKAGKVGLERVDYHMAVDFARAVQAAGARRFIVVSSLGAAARSPAFYSRVKARMERAVSEIGFEGVDIVRPSLLLGARSDTRPAEDIAQKLAPLIGPLFVGPLKAYRPIDAAAVAQAMIDLADEPAQGLRVHTLPRG
jgi:uncharacterized protein YbjT (DUF2867 family)